MWDTTEGEKFFRVFFGTFRAFLGIIGSFTLHRGRHRRLEHHVRRGGGAHPRDRHQAGGGGQAPLHPGPVPARDAHPHRGGRRCSASSSRCGVIAVFPAQLDEYVGTPEASPVVILTTATLLGVIGLAAGYFPARRASLLDPVVALKLS